MKQQADKHWREVSYEVGEIESYKLEQLAKRLNQKLSPWFYGPFEGLERIGEVAFKLNLPTERRLHSVFHASLLKKAIVATTTVQPLPSCLAENFQLQVLPEDLLAVRKTQNDTTKVLVKWKQLPDFENSWEDFEDMKGQFPYFHFEDKVNVLGGSIDENTT